MKISEAIAALDACLDQFGDVECAFTTSADGNPALELRNVDTTAINAENPKPKTQNPNEEEIRRFNARFPVKDIFIPSRN